MQVFYYMFKFSTHALQSKRGGSRRGAGRPPGAQNKARVSSQKNRLGFVALKKPPCKGSLSSSLDAAQTIELLAETISTKFAEQLDARLAGLTKQLSSLKKTNAVLVDALVEKAAPVCQPAKKSQRTSPFLVMLSNGNYYCKCCTDHQAIVCTTSSQQGSPWLHKNGGVSGGDKRWANKKNRHFFDDDGNGGQGAQCHQQAAAMDKQKGKRLIQKGVAEIEKRAKEQMSALLRTVLYICERNHSMTEYEHLVNLQFENGAEVGGSEHSRRTCRKMILFVEEWLREQQKAFIRTANPATGRLPHVGAKADKMSDPLTMKKQYQITTIRANYKGAKFSECTLLFFTYRTLGAPLTMLSSLEEVSANFNKDKHADGFRYVSFLCPFLH